MGVRQILQLARDALEIHAPLAHRLGVHQLSAGLEDLAFKALYPSEYEEVRMVVRDVGRDFVLNGNLLFIYFFVLEVPL